MNLQSWNTARSVRALLALGAVLASAFAALSVTGAAAAASPCGQKVLADWFDNGRIDRLYPLHCYEEAIDAIPSDIRDYANAEDVISRALQSALRGKLDRQGGPDPTPGDNPTGSGTSGTGGDGGGSSDGGSGSDSADGASGGSPEAAPAVNTSGPSSLPLPLVVLGGLALALLAAGGIGYLSRRRQGRAPGA